MTRTLSIAVLCALLAACANRPPQDHVALPPAPPRGEPTGVVGQSAGAIRAAYGTPVFTRKDGDTEMWRYDGEKCRAFFFLYPNGAELAVRHVETVPRPSDAAADETCLKALRIAAPVS